MGSLSAVDSPLIYPKARRDESIIDYYHGLSVPDPYRWLEDPDSEETREFVRKQVEATESVLKTCQTRDKIRLCLNEAFQFERYRVPFYRGSNKLFFFHNQGLQPQDVLFVQDGLEGEAKVLLDPNELSEDGTVSMSIMAVSENAEYMAYGLSTSGSDWITIKVMQIQDRLTLPDTISWVKFSGISWTHDGRGFFYCRFPAPNRGERGDAGTETNINLNHELYYHVLGTDQSQDILCWKDPQHPKYRFYTKVTDDGKYLLLNIGETCEEVNKLYYLNLSALTNGLGNAQASSGLLPFKKLVDDLDALYEFVANDDSMFTFLTNKDAPRRKLVRVDLNKPGSWTDVIPESEKHVLVTAQAVNQNQLIVCYLSDVKHVVEIRDLQTGSLLHPLPIDIGTVTISAQRKHSTAFIGFTNFLTFNTVYQCDLASGVPKMKIFREISVPKFDRSLFKVDQVFVPSKDGTKIPMFIVAKKDLVLDRSNPCLLFAYGGFSISVTPCFSVIRTILLRHLDVVFCLANIRGGGEYGEEWHKVGSLDKKQNCFDDFIAAAEFLVSNGYTQPSKLCIEGRSNGGLLIGACINQRPDLFGCALAHAGVMDMLRFHKFTIGHAWTCDFGCSDNEEHFRWLIKYSPLHNVRRPWENTYGGYIQYPSTMLLTADHDDRVVPLHSLKLLATMQYTLCSSLARSPQINPIIGRIECKAGHGCGRPIQKEIDEAADRYSFMAKVVNASWID